MMIDLSAEERDLVVKFLESALEELRVEVRRTGTPKYHDRLEHDEKLLEGVLERLRQAG
jgi:hypothetical protein